jgi:hypothetical protein
VDSEILLETNGDKNYHVSAYNTDSTKKMAAKEMILFSLPGLGRHNLDLVVDYCVANACAPSYVRAGSSSTEGFAMIS